MSEKIFLHTLEEVHKSRANLAKYFNLHQPNDLGLLRRKPNQERQLKFEKPCVFELRIALGEDRGEDCTADWFEQ